MVIKEIKIPVMGPTTKLTTIADEAPVLLTGDESYPLVGENPGDRRDSISGDQIRRIIRAMKGMNKHWDCLPKAQAVREVLGFGVVVVGSLFVVSGDHKSEYGYLFNPPFEFHAWVILDDPRVYWNPRLFDFGLAGVIDKGLNTSDDQGPYLVDREPAILKGVPPEWCRYVPVEVIR
jgi:hypothetical protein